MYNCRSSTFESLHRTDKDTGRKNGDTLTRFCGPGLDHGDRGRVNLIVFGVEAVVGLVRLLVWMGWNCGYGRGEIVDMDGVELWV